MKTRKKQTRSTQMGMGMCSRENKEREGKERNRNGSLYRDDILSGSS